MVRESRARKQKAVQWPPGGGSSAFCIAPRPKWVMTETRPSPKVGPRTKPLGSGVARRRRGRPRFTFLRYMTRLGVARVLIAQRAVQSPAVQCTGIHPHAAPHHVLWHLQHVGRYMLWGTGGFRLLLQS